MGRDGRLGVSALRGGAGKSRGAERSWRGSGLDSWPSHIGTQTLRNVNETAPRPAKLHANFLHYNHLAAVYARFRTPMNGLTLSALQGVG